MGNITLTGTGVTTLGTAVLWADYSYLRIKFTNTQLQESLDRAQTEIDKKTRNHFLTGTDITPDWIKHNKEEQDGKGTFDKAYYTDSFPVRGTATVTSAVVGTSATIVYVNGTNGYPAAGFLTIERDRVDYTAKTSTAFTGCSGVTTSHGTAINVLPYVIEVSTTDSGTTPTFQVQQSDTDYDLDKETGRMHLYNGCTGTLSVLDNTVPPRMVPNRVRISYLSGESPIPKDITRATLMIAAKDLMHTTARKSLMDGNNEFNPDTIGLDKIWIDETIDSYRNTKTSNT